MNCESNKPEKIFFNPKDSHVYSIHMIIPNIREIGDIISINSV